MIKNILSAIDPLLRIKSKPVVKIDKKILSLIKDLKETLSVQENPEGVGLAAPQIGKNLQIFVMKKLNNSLQTIINPSVLSVQKKLVKTSTSTKKNRIMEGCLSLPNFYGSLKRPEKITIEYLNEEANKVDQVFEGFEAQIIQHEIDHLNGILFVDRLLEQKKKLYELKKDEWYEVDLPQ